MENVYCGEKKNYTWISIFCCINKLFNFVFQELLSALILQKSLDLSRYIIIFTCKHLKLLPPDYLGLMWHLLFFNI